jgi:dihydroorotate dehydrogenase (NAD+) catalytic subunit
MIELAPGHKQGLPTANPLWIAGGMIGYGEATPRGLNLAALGGVVAGPIMAMSRAGADLPRMAQTPGGMVLETGWQNRGASNVIANYAKLWPKLGCPVVAQVVDEDARRMAKVAERIASVAGVAGLELVLLTQEVKNATSMVRSVLRVCDLPIWVKLSLENAVAWAAPLAEIGVNGLVIGQPPRGALATQHGAVVNGGLYGPLSFALTLPVLQAVARLQLPVALIACGGVHSVEQLYAALDAGASAVQIDSALWIEPALPNWLVEEWGEREQSRLKKR